MEEKKVFATHERQAMRRAYNVGKNEERTKKMVEMFENSNSWRNC